MDGQSAYPFEFSVVMAVYNVEPWIREAVDSLIAQGFGFEKIQLIMVDDGSTDGSGAICDEYAARYPENVVVIHKENGGVSSARNEGLKHIQGRYVNFLDSDDKLDRNTMSAVYDFFQLHEGETDVAAIPIHYFDGMDGEHILNTKFEQGTRVIHLIQEWRTIQMSCASSFFTAAQAGKMCFDTSIAYGEDAKEMQKVLLGKMTLGVVDSCAYQYRRRSVGAGSALQNTRNNVLWYLPSVKGFLEGIIAHCMKECGYVPKFVQNSLLYDMQWRILQEEIPASLMAKDAQEEYKNRLLSLLRYFDDDVIMAQRDIQIEHKAYLLKKKYGRDADIQWGYRDGVLHYQTTYLCHLNTNKTHLDFISVAEDSVCVEGYMILIAGNYGEAKAFAEWDGRVIPCTPVSRDVDKKSLGETICHGYGFRCELPLEPDRDRHTLSLFCEADGRRIDRNNLVFGKFCPVSSEYQTSYFYHRGRVITTDGSHIFIRTCGRGERMGQELSYLKEIWQKNDLGARKAVLARLLVHLLKPFVRKKIWLISDRVDKADDNGEAFFRYLAETPHPGIKPYFALSPQSPDYGRLKKVGRVIPFGGWRYKILYLLADSMISSQGEEYIFHPFREYSGLYRDMAQRQKFIFLQHGVLENDLSGWLSRYNKNISMFVTTTASEHAAVLSGPYGYTSKVVKLTGLPRYDRLYHQERKMITIMPTWRAYLVTGVIPSTGRRELKAGFRESQYFAMYNQLLNDQRLFDTAKKMGYTIAFLNHPNMTSAAEKMTSDPQLQWLKQGTPYRDIFARSDLVITDYSSVAFDFAYLRKPVIYYQTDKDTFFSGAHTCGIGYFDYERDGFGEVEYSVEALVERIIAYMENGCKLKEEYRARIDATFPFHDQNNCQRVYEEILKLDKQG